MVADAKTTAEIAFELDKSTLLTDRKKFTESQSTDLLLRSYGIPSTTPRSVDSAFNHGLTEPADSAFRPHLSSSIAYWMFRNYRGFDKNLVDTDDFKCVRRIAVTARSLVQSALIIDDIQDDSKERYGRPAHHIQFGVPRSLNVSIWGIIASLRHVENPRAVAEFMKLIQGGFVGQAIDIADRDEKIQKNVLESSLHERRKHYDILIRQKACFLGILPVTPTAAALNIDQGDVHLIAQAMENLGFPIQIFDDVTDFLPTSDPRMKNSESVKNDSSFIVNNLVCLELLSQLDKEEQSSILSGAPQEIWKRMTNHRLVGPVILQLVERSKFLYEEALRQISPLFTSEASEIYFNKAMADNHMNAVKAQWRKVEGLYRKS